VLFRHQHLAVGHGFATLFTTRGRIATAAVRCAFGGAFLMRQRGIAAADHAAGAGVRAAGAGDRRCCALDAAAAIERDTYSAEHRVKAIALPHDVHDARAADSPFIGGLLIDLFG